jgi:co-chaperonin GroES (HSP10)
LNWPENYKLISDALIADIQLPPEDENGIILLNRDPRKQEVLPDCYTGKVLEVGTQCKLVKVGDEIVFQRWQYSQSDLDDTRVCLREIDLVVVNEKCVNGYAACQVFDPFAKTHQLTFPGRRERPRYYYGKVIDIDPYSKNPDTKDVKAGDIVLFQHMDQEQFWVGKHTKVFKNIYDVILMVLEPALEEALV